MPDTRLAMAEKLDLRMFGTGWTAFRVGYTLLLGLTFTTGALEFQSLGYERVFLFGLAAFLLVPFVYAPWFALHQESALKWIWAFLPIDLIALTAMTFTLVPAEDPLYPVFAGLALFYASIGQTRATWMVSAVIALVYLSAHAGHTLTFDADASHIIYIAAKGLALPVLGLFVGQWMETRAERELELASHRASIETLNEELTKRLAELHIVTEITEVIHSTLDFESIGHVVLDSLKKAIDMPTCSLMVIDRKSDETIFSASAGMSEAGVEPPMTGYFPGPDGVLDDDTTGPMFTCTNILDHNEMGVVFCCPADRLDGLSQDDTLVLQAVASELVVAVENSRLYQLTKRLSITDELTGLRNYRFLQQRLDQEYDRANRYNRYLSLLMLDIDFFKQFNDEHGHIAGDQALTDLAGILTACVREVDIVARYGGEEFSIILPETDAAGAFVVAEKIREAVAEHGFANPDGEPTEHMTISVGVATFPVHALDREALLRQADDALYQAKHFGRDRVRAPRIASEASG